MPLFVVLVVLGVIGLVTYVKVNKSEKAHKIFTDITGGETTDGIIADKEEVDSRAKSHVKSTLDKIQSDMKSIDKLID